MKSPRGLRFEGQPASAPSLVEGVEAEAGSLTPPEKLDASQVVAEAERLLQELAQVPPALSLREVEETIAEQERLSDIQGRVFVKLLEMPEITRRAQLRAVQRARAETQAGLWEDLTPESYDQLAAKGLIKEDEAEALNKILGVVQDFRGKMREAAGNEPLTAELQGKLQYAELVRSNFAHALGIEEKLARIRQEVRAEQEKAVSEVTERYSRAAAALGETLERYAQELQAVEEHPQVQARLAEIEAEKQKLAEIEKAEQELFRQAQAAAESVRAKNRNAYQRLVEATDEEGLVEELRKAYRGQDKYAHPERENWPGQAAQKFFDRTVQAAHQAGVQSWQLRPWAYRTTTRSYEADQYLVLGPQVRTLIEKEQGRFQELEETREEIRLDRNVLNYLAERLGRYSRQQEKIAKREAARQATKEQARIEVEIGRITQVVSESKGGFVVLVPTDQGARRAGLGLELGTVSRGKKKAACWQVVELAGGIPVNGAGAREVQTGDRLSLDLTRGVDRAGHWFELPEFVAQSARQSGALLTRGQEFPEFYPREESEGKEEGE